MTIEIKEANGFAVLGEWLVGYLGRWEALRASQEAGLKQVGLSFGKWQEGYIAARDDLIEDAIEYLGTQS